MLRIGIDLGGTKTEGIVMAADGRILVRERRPTPRAEGYRAILDAIVALASDLEKQAGQACRIGIGTPGSISLPAGLLKNSNTVCMNGMPVKADFEKLLNRKIRIANDANCFALSEALDGAGQGRGVVFGVILGTGVGGGLVFHGRLHEGPQHIAGEWGHNVLEPDGPPCYCGKRGCVETFLSGPGLALDFQMHGGDPGLDAQAIVAAAGHDEALAETANANYRMSGRTSEASRVSDTSRGPRLDPIAEAAMQRYLDRFGRALAVVVNILDPDVVVLGGGMSNIARLYTEGRKRVARYIFAAHGCANVAEDTTPGMEEVEPRREQRPTTPGMDDSKDGGGRAVSGTTAEEVEPCRATAWMHDSRDGGGRAASGTKAEEVEQRREQLPEQRPRMSGAANDAPHTNILPNVHGDSSGVRGAAQLWRPGE